MKTKNIVVLCALVLTSAAVPANAAISLGQLTFEGTSSPFFVFAQNETSILSVYGVPGTNGTLGVAARVTGSPGSFAGGGAGGPAGPFDLATAGVSAGQVTLETVNAIRGSFDVLVPVGQAITLRLEPGNGGFNDRIDLGGTITGTGSFQAVAFDVSLSANNTQKGSFVSALNMGNSTGVRFVFGINNQAGAVGSDFVFDNLQLNVVPEPSSVMTLAAAGLALTLRRRRK